MEADDKASKTEVQAEIRRDNLSNGATASKAFIKLKEGGMIVAAPCYI